MAAVVDSEDDDDEMLLNVRGSVRLIGAATSGESQYGSTMGTSGTYLWATLNVSLDEWVALGQCCLKRLGRRRGRRMSYI